MRRNLASCLFEPPALPFLPRGRLREFLDDASERPLNLSKRRVPRWSAHRKPQSSGVLFVVRAAPWGK